MNKLILLLITTVSIANAKQGNSDTLILINNNVLAGDWTFSKIMGKHFKDGDRKYYLPQVHSIKTGDDYYLIKNNNLYKRVEPARIELYCWTSNIVKYDELPDYLTSVSSPLARRSSMAIPRSHRPDFFIPREHNPDVQMKFDFLGRNVEKYVASNPKALKEIRTFRKCKIASILLTSVGLLSTVASLSMFDNDAEDQSILFKPLLYIGVGSLVASIFPGMLSLQMDMEAINIYNE